MEKLLLCFLALLFIDTVYGIAMPVIDVEVLESGKDFVRARFEPTMYIRDYLVSVHPETVNGEDGMSIPKGTKLGLNYGNLPEDGYHIIEVFNLKSGTEYIVEVYYDKRIPIGAGYFFTDCPANKFQCTRMNSIRPNIATCLSEDDLCDGVVSCTDAEDESMSPDGTCTSLALVQSKSQECLKARKEAEKLYTVAPDCEEDGSFSPIRCLNEFDGNQFCFCVSPEVGAPLDVVQNYDYFLHAAFLDRCMELRRTNTSNVNKTTPGEEEDSSGEGSGDEEEIETKFKKPKHIDVEIVLAEETSMTIVWKVPLGFENAKFVAYAAMAKLADFPSTPSPVVYGNRAYGGLLLTSIHNLTPNTEYVVHIIGKIKNKRNIAMSDFLHKKTTSNGQI